MKISELQQSSSVSRAMQIPVAIAGENRSLTLGQIIDALAATIVPFTFVDETNYAFSQIAQGTTLTALPIVYRPDGNFYARLTTTSVSAGIISKQVTYYTNFPSRNLFYDDEGNVRTDCLFISSEGRLYRYNGSNLISAGITDAQAQQLKLLTPIEVADESTLQAMEEAGQIVPGQLYYIPEDD